jgi:hypothetical protein
VTYLNFKASLPLVALILLGVTVAQAIPFAFLGPYYGAPGTGAVYFDNAFSADSVGWSYSCIFFTNFNMTAGSFGTVGFGADAGVTVTVREVIPDNSIHVFVAAPAGGSFRVYTPAKAPLNVTGATSWTYNGLYTELVMPAGNADVYLGFTTTNEVTYYVPEWLLNAFGFLTGLTNVVTNMIALLKVFTAYLTTSIANVTTFIASIMTFIFFVSGGVIYWFTSTSAMFINVFTKAGQLIDNSSLALYGVGNGIGNLWTYFGFNQWIGLVPLFAIVFWFYGLGSRSVKSGRGLIEIAVGDFQIVSYIVGEVWGWLYLIINFVFNTAMSLASIVTGK